MKTIIDIKKGQKAVVINNLSNSFEIGEEITFTGEIDSKSYFYEIGYQFVNKHGDKQELFDSYFELI